MDTYNTLEAEKKNTQVRFEVPLEVIAVVAVTVIGLRYIDYLTKLPKK